jgi:hypothetical protein
MSAKFGNIIRVDNSGSFGSHGGVHVKMDDGKDAFLAGSYYRMTHPGRLLEGQRIELLENGRYWTALQGPHTEHPLFHPDTHPEPPPVSHHVDASPIARVPRMSQRHEPEPPATLDGLQLLGGILVALDRNNELLGQILHHLKEEAIEPL